MRKIFFLVFLVSVSVSTAQQKYYIFFKDKGISENTVLKKTSPIYQQAEELLTPLSIERRKQVMGEDYIKFEDLPLSADYVSAIEKSGIKIQNKLKWFNAVTAYLNEEQLDVIRKFYFVAGFKTVAILKQPEEMISGNSSGQSAAESSLRKSAYGLDYGYSLTQNQLSRIPEVHDLGISGKDVLVGILDTGFRWRTHPALENTKVVAEYDFINKDNITANEGSDVSSQDSHGTDVLSIIGGFAPGSLIGPAYGASYLLAKTEYIPTETHVEEDNYAAALEWMESQGVQITTSSLGYSEFDSPEFSYTYADMNGNTTIVAKAANLAFERGVSTFTAAGNEGNGLWYYIVSPGDAPNMITVGSVTSKNVRSSFSSHGPASDGRIKPEIVAMGSGVFHATTSPSLYGSGSGTSYATPIAAGIGALLKSAFPHLNNKQIRQIFIACGDSTNTPNNNVGYGLISALRAATYPNFSYVNNIYTLHKIVIDSQKVVPQSLTLNYRIGNGSYQTAAMQKDGNVKFQYSLPMLNNNSYVGFYFKYNDSKGIEIREPFNGEYSFVANSTALSPVTEVTDAGEIQTGFRLYQNYPNPFNPVTTIKFSIPSVETQNSASLQNVILKIYDILGREVKTLVKEDLAPGNYQVEFDGSSISSGVYIYTLRSGTFSESRKLLLLK